MTSTVSFALLARCCACLLFLALPASAQESPAPGASGAPASPRESAPVVGASWRRVEEPVVYLTEWPKPADKDTLLTDIERLCKSNTPLMGVQAREALVANGASGVPFILDRYGKERDPAAIKRLHEVLVQVTAAGQTRLLAKRFEAKSGVERTFVLWRTAAFPDKELRVPAEAALARVQKQGEKADPEERYAAALCAVSAGSLQGLEILCEVAMVKWDKRGTEMRTALESARGPEATEVVLAKLSGATGKEETAARKERVAALNVLAGCGDKAAAGKLKPYLDDSDNSVRIAVINALRGMVDGAPPLPLLSAFEAIETAKQWKERI